MRWFHNFFIAAVVSISWSCWCKFVSTRPWREKWIIVCWMVSIKMCWICYLTYWDMVCIGNFCLFHNHLHNWMNNLILWPPFQMWLWTVLVHYQHTLIPCFLKNEILPYNILNINNSHGHCFVVLAWMKHMHIHQYFKVILLNWYCVLEYKLQCVVRLT